MRLPAAGFRRKSGRIHRQQKETIVFVTHDIDEALRLGTRIVVMDEGKIIQDGTPEEIRANRLQIS